MARVLAISSHVARGNVGLAVTVPALQGLGHEVWALPTIVLASRPGYGFFAKHEMPPAELEKMLAALETDGCWQSLNAVFTGYFPSPRTIDMIAQAIARIREVNPDVLVLVDPVLGDAGRLYVAEETAAAVRDQLLPLASVATPNLFELQWLAGVSPFTRGGTAEAARGLATPIVVVTSAYETPENVTTLLVTPEGTVEELLPARTGIPNGAGDLFAGLLLGHMLKGDAPAAALQAALRDLDPVLAASQGQPVLQLSALTAGQT